MNKWRTSQRRGRGKTSTGSGGNLSGGVGSQGETTDDSSMSFLDEMLVSAPKQSSSSSGGASGGNTRNSGSNHRPPAAPVSTEDIAEILDMVSTGGSVSSRKSAGSRSGASGRSGTSRSGNHSGRQDPYYETSDPIAPYTPRSSSRPQGRYSNGGGSRSREHSPSPQPSPSSQPRRRRRSSRSPKPAEFSGDRRIMRAQDLVADAVGEDAGDDVMPIPVFSVNPPVEDDEISQITTSVTSYYESDSRGSAPFSWTRSSYRPTNNKSIPSNGDPSYADTLDEIADMLQPNQGNGTHHPRPQSRNGRPADGPLMRMNGTSGGGGVTDDLFRAPGKSTDDLFGPNKDSTPLYNPNKKEAPKLRADEIYRSTKHVDRASGQNGRSQKIFSGSASSFEALLSQTRFQVRYVMSRVLPKAWRTGRKGSKDDGLPTWQTNSKKRGSKSFQSIPHILMVLFGVFCVMTLIIFLVRLGMANGFGSRGRGHGPVSSRIKRKGGSSSSETHGGMASRGNSHVAGGMAHHDINAEAGRSGHHAVEAVENRHKYDHGEHDGVTLPPALDNLADVTDLPFHKGVEVPLFFHVPRSGGGTVNDVFGQCLSLTLASDAGGSGTAGTSNKLEVVEFSKQLRYVNVDTSSPTGIERARYLGLAESGVADVVVSSLLYKSATLFNPTNRGRLFTMLRHPVERAVSLFHFVQDTQWRRRHTFRKELSDLSIDEYFKSGLSENNWLTRFLIDEPTKGQLTKRDVNLAKEVLRRKCLVGLLKEKGESFARFERYFGFPLRDDAQKDCHEKKLQWAWPLKHRHDEVEEGTPLYDLILSHNTYDMELYHYASEVLFHEQAKIFL